MKRWERRTHWSRFRGDEGRGMESKDKNAFEDFGRKSEVFLNGLIAGRENMVKKNKVYFIFIRWEKSQYVCC